MRCAKCGQENPQGKIVCSRCGTRLRPAAAGGAMPQQNPEEFMGYLRADLIRLAVVTVVVIAGALLLSQYVF